MPDQRCGGGSMRAGDEVWAHAFRGIPPHVYISACWLSSVVVLVSWSSNWLVDELHGGVSGCRVLLSNAFGAIQKACPSAKRILICLNRSVVNFGLTERAAMCMGVW